METDVGFVCGRCDAYVPFESTVCPSCHADLGFGSPTPVVSNLAATSADEPVRSGLLEEAPPIVGPVQIPAGFVPTEPLMEQARSYVCKKCYTPVPLGHKFCGRCGESVP